MQNRKFIPLLMAITLLLNSLACMLSGGVGTISVTYIVPDTSTPALTPAPTPAPPEPGNGGAKPTTEKPIPPPGTYPIRIQDTGTKTEYSAFTQSTCKADASALLVIQANGDALLATTGPQYADSYNCDTPMEVTYDIDGKADPATETVVFYGCNNWGFSATGFLYYSEGKLKGEVSCASKSGDVMTLTIP